MSATSTLLHIDRRAYTAWLAMTGLDSSVIGREVGEGLRLATGIDRRDDPAAALVRWSLPISCTLAHTEVTRDADAAATKLIATAGPARAATIVIVRRHGRFAAEALTRALTDRLALHAAEAPAASDDPQLYVLCSDEAIYAGVGRPSICGSAFAGGMPPWCHAGAAGDVASRAGDKLREAHAWLHVATDLVEWPSRWLELGAFPGGMTEILAARGVQVEAVDKAPPSPALTPLIASGRVSYATADALTYEPTAPFDALLCDVNGPPRPALENLLRLASWHRVGGVLIHTVKLPAWEAWPALKALADERLPASGYDQISVRHLAANRQELTLFARKVR